MTMTTTDRTTVTTMTTERTRRHHVVVDPSAGPDDRTEQLDVVGLAAQPPSDVDGAQETSADESSPAGRELVVRVPVPDVVATLSRTRRRVTAGLRGIRGQLVLSYVLLVAGALVVTLVVVRQVLLVQADRGIEASLEQEVEELRRLAGGVDPDTGEAFGADVTAIFDTFLARNVPSEGEVFLTIVGGEPYLETRGPGDLASDPALVERWSTLDEPLRLDVGQDDAAARTLAVPLLDADGGTAGVFVVAVFPRDAHAEVASAVRAIGGVGLLVLGLAALVALGLARRVLRPVEALTETSRRISDNDLTARFDARGDDELARLGDAFDAMLDRLERGFADQRQVLDDVAHELRTPITIVQGHLELLDADDDPADRAETVAVCLDELDRMARYVNELLVVASANRPDFLHPALVDVGEFAEGLLVRVEQIASRRWSLEQAPRPGSSIIEADEQRLTQVMVNLAANAAQHTSDGDRIELSVQVDEAAGEVRFAVRDHGPGVAPDVRDDLFHRFSRGARSRTTRPDGTGLGLAIVVAIAEAHGGRVGFEDPPGGGARFVVTLPLPADDPEELE